MCPEDLEKTISGVSEQVTADLFADGLPPLDSTGELCGKILSGKYEMLAQIGQGGMGVVYKARHTLLNKIVAVKMLHPHLVGISTNQLRFKQEAEAASRINHPNVVAVHDFGVTEDGKPFIVMDYIEGRLLSDVLLDGQLPFERFIHIFMQTCDALEHAHKKGIIHRDLKPSNIILVPSAGDPDFVKIVDFGIAKLLSETDSKAVTQTGETIGSPQYMSPEQCLGQKMDVRSDIYSMGCLMYQALSGKPPVDGESVFEIMYRQINEVPAGFRVLRPDIGNVERLEATVFKAVSKSPSERYQSMSALKDALSVAAGGQRGWALKLMDQMQVIRLKLLPQKKSLAHKAILTCVISGLVLTSALSLYRVVAPPEVPLSALPMSLWPPFQSEAKPEPEGYDLKKLLGRVMLGHIEKEFGEDSTAYVQRLEESKRLCLMHGKYADAVPFIRKLIELAIKGDFAEDYRATVLAPLYYYLGECLYFEGDYKEAGKQYANSLQVLDSFDLKPEMRELGLPLSRLADTYYFRRQFGIAEHLYRKALPCWGRKDSTESPADLASFHSKFGDCCYRTGKLSDAERSFARAKDLWAGLPGSANQRNSAMCLDMLALIHYNNWLKAQASRDAAAMKENSAEARSDFRKAVGLLESAAPNSRDQALCLKQEADFLWRSGRWWDSMAANYRANQILSYEAHTDRNKR